MDKDKGREGDQEGAVYIGLVRREDWTSFLFGSGNPTSQWKNDEPRT